jgi:hypothetical protein
MARRMAQESSPPNHYGCADGGVRPRAGDQREKDYRGEAAEERLYKCRRVETHQTNARISISERGKGLAHLQEVSGQDAKAVSSESAPASEWRRCRDFLQEGWIHRDREVGR